MRYLLLLIMLWFSSEAFAQLGFCEGSKGDPIFHETFGAGQNTGPPLSSNITNYTYVTGDPEDGQYTISGRIGMNNPSWHSYLPQGSLSQGKALIVNADFNSGRFYRKQIFDLCENTSYEFSAYLLNVYNRSSGICPNGGIPNNVRFEIWDETDAVLLKEGSTGDIPSTSSPVWKQFALTFQTQPGQESIILKMYNNGDGGCGNDLAIDDIIFRSCGDLTRILEEETSLNQRNFCEVETPVTITLKATPDYSVYSRHAFQWQESDDDQTWRDIPGETGGNYTTPAITTSRYYRVKVAEDEVNLNNNLCSSVSEAFFVNIIGTPEAPVSNGDIEICSDAVIPALSVEVEEDEQVNWYDAATGGNLVAEGPSFFVPPGEGTYYAAAIKTGYDCSPGSRTAVSLIINGVPEVEDEEKQICEGTVILLDAGMANMDYQWSTGESSRQINISTAGNYSVQITTLAGCSITKNFFVESVEVPGIAEINSDERQITIVPVREGSFEYSIDGINYQPSNIFEAVNGGIYTAYVRDLSGCDTATRRFVHLVIPRYVTPNNDGFNDYFEIPGISFLGTSEIRIYDRYGKLLKWGRGENFRWNGSFNGKPLPAEDYWYEVQISGLESIKGHFTLIR